MFKFDISSYFLVATVRASVLDLKTTLYKGIFASLLISWPTQLQFHIDNTVMIFLSNATVNITQYQAGRDIGLFRVSAIIPPGETVIFRSLSTSCHYHDLIYHDRFPCKHYHVFWQNYHDHAITSSGHYQPFIIISFIAMILLASIIIYFVIILLIMLFLLEWPTRSFWAEEMGNTSWE